jgi:anti-sigma B factor antagonist
MDRPFGNLYGLAVAVRIGAMDYMDFNIKRPASRYKGQRVFVLEGPLTRSTLTEFEDVVRAEKAAVVIVDLSAVPYVDSDGLGALIKAHISCTKSGRRLALAGVPIRLRTLLKVTGVEQIITTFSSVKEAQKALHKK